MTGARKPRDYKAEWAKRKARAARIGAGLGLDGLTPQGLTALRKQGAGSRALGVLGPRPQHSTALDRWGVTAKQVEDMHFQNLEYSPEQLYKKNAKSSASAARLSMAYSANAYNDERGGRIGDYSDDRVGYVVTFYRAVVDPKSNYDSLMGVDENGRKLRRIKNGKPVSNKWQREYLTKYAQLIGEARDRYIEHNGLMSVDEYEQRYGLYNGVE